MENSNFFRRNWPDKKENNYSQKEIEYHLEILPKHRKTSIKSLYLNDNLLSEELRAKK